jgi:hypothetical protein
MMTTEDWIVIGISFGIVIGWILIGEFLTVRKDFRETSRQFEDDDGTTASDGE